MFNSNSSSIRSQIYGLVTNRWAITCCSMLVFQQILEASSTYWLVQLMASVTKGENFTLYLILYLAALIIPYIPWCWAFVLKITWKQEAQRSLTNAFIAANKNNIGEWSNKGLKEQKLSILTSEGPATIHAFIDYMWDLIYYFSSVTLNILALSIVVEPLFAIAYAFSISLVVIVMKIKRRTQRQLTLKAMTARIDLCQSLFAAWDNVLLGNDYNFNLWMEKNTSRLNRCLQRNVALERFDQFLAIFISFLTSVPCLLVVAYFVINNRNDLVTLSSFIVILPILFLILSYTYLTLSLAFRWNMHRSKLTAIYKSIQGSKETHNSLERKVKWGKMMFTNSFVDPTETATPETSVSLAYPQPINSHQDLLKQTYHSGRVTVRGENGCGKSTALMLIKNALEKRAFFLPTYSQLSFHSETNKYSTGESLKNRLMEILEKVDADILLLDEWDANLDKENQEILSSLINELSEKKCVIEVRHR